TQETLGLPGAYDLGLERLSWMCHAVQNWVGDRGRLSFIEARYKKFNYLGDVTWATGKVIEKLERDGRKLVQLDLWTINHRDQITATAGAGARLPSRGGCTRRAPARRRPPPSERRCGWRAEPRARCRRSAPSAGKRCWQPRARSSARCRHPFRVPAARAGSAGRARTVAPAA